MSSTAGRPASAPALPGGLPAIGETVNVRGRPWTLLGRRQHWRRLDGALTEILTWQGRCVTCGAIFKARCGPEAGGLPPVANCKAHRGTRTEAQRAAGRRWAEAMAERWRTGTVSEAERAGRQRWAEAMALRRKRRRQARELYEGAI